jgi:ubiquinone/menaquinone biosynthesis C-methylase UbiE
VTGVTLGEDAIIARSNGFDVRQVDMTFLPFNDKSFNLIFARHVIEHSPMPLLTLLEWYRVSRNYLLLVVPSYQHYKAQGHNHYYVLLANQWKCLLERAGWSVVWQDRSKELMEPWEIRWMCQKVEQ